MMMELVLTELGCDESVVTPLVLHQLFKSRKRRKQRQFVLIKIREKHFYGSLQTPDWLLHYTEMTFFQLFRMQKNSFSQLLTRLCRSDQYGLLNNAVQNHPGGRTRVKAEKALLIFLWYMGTQDTLISMTETFKVVQSTIMDIVNRILYLIVKLKNEFIFWPRTQHEIDHVVNGFSHYPNTLGAVDGSHINIKVVPKHQQESYINRHQRHSINAMVICTSEKILTYAFIGFPGSAHDSRVFAKSSFVENIERLGAQYYFPDNDYHIVGDSAFPIKLWMMTPYKRQHILNARELNHNRQLSADRVAVENIFARIKGRFRRLIYINAYSISKCVEIATAACILHNFCYMNRDEWDELYIEEREDRAEGNNAEVDPEARQGKQKRDRISYELMQ